MDMTRRKARMKTFFLRFSPRASFIFYTFNEEHSYFNIGFFKEYCMGPRQFKTCVYSSKPCDDLTGPGPPPAV